MSRLIFVLVLLAWGNVAVGQQETDYLKELQRRAVQLNRANWIHWGERPNVFSGHTNHSNRLIPVYTWGLTLDSVRDAQSVYRDAEELKKVYGFAPQSSVNPEATYFDQTQIYHLQKQAWKAGKKNVILLLFDGMDWETTQAASIFKNKSVLYTQGRGSGLGFLDYLPTDAKCDYGYCVTSPHNSKTKTNVNSQTIQAAAERFGGYSAELGSSMPWAKVGDARYLLGKRPDVPHPYTDSAASATSLNSGVKTYNDAINVDAQGNQLTPLAREMQKKGYAVGIVTSVPISHATPACSYANNVNRGDYQDITRDMLGLKSISHREQALPGVDVLIGCGWKETKADDRTKQGSNYVPGNKYLAEKDLNKIDVTNGGKYVVVERTPGKPGRQVLFEGAELAIKNNSRLFGFFGVDGGHLPYQTADGNFDPAPGVRVADEYRKQDVRENPTLADFTDAALQVLAKNDKGFFLSVEAGDVDWANHNNNIDDAIGAVFSGDDAFEVIVNWVEKNSNWEETCLILTADHGHYMVLDRPETLAGKQPPATESMFAKQMEAKQKAEDAKLAADIAKADTEAVDEGGFVDKFESEKHDLRKALRGKWTYTNGVGKCIADPLLYKKFKNHGPILRYPVEFKNGIIEFEVRTQNAKRLVFTFNEKGHVFRTIHDKKNSRIIGWKGPSKTTKPDVLAKTGFPDIESLNGRWTKFKIATKGETAILNIGSHVEYLNHPSIGRAKKEVTLSFHFGELEIKNLRFRPTPDAEPAPGTVSGGDASAVPQSSDEKFTSIFDGESLKGWHNPYDWGNVDVSDNEVKLLANKKFFLMTNRQYGDFVFEGEVRLPEGKSNSGFMLRGQEKINKVFGYQAEADPTDRKWSGGLYDESRRQWLNPLKDQPEAQEAFKKTDWNHYRIECEGDHLQVWVNGVQTTDYYDPVDLMGGIGLQHHGEKGQTYRFRNLKIADKGRHVWKPLFDGSSMEGWKTAGGGNWKLVDGVLVGTSSATEKRHGLFYSEGSYSDFTVRLTFRLSEGNSGFYFRSKINDSDLGIAGIQAELENSEAIGGLYETAGRAWLAKPLHYFDHFSEDRQAGRRKQWAKAHMAGEWSTLVVSVHGDRIVTHVGDILACDVVDPLQKKKGQFALQLHGSQDMKLEVKSIEMLTKY